MTNRQQTNNNRIQQQRLRNRRKEEGWKRVTVWVSPEVASCLQAIDPNLGTAIYEVINKLSDNLVESVVTTDNPIDSVNDFDLSASEQQVRKSSVKYHDKIKLMAWRMHCGGGNTGTDSRCYSIRIGRTFIKVVYESHQSTYQFRETISGG